MPGIWDWWSVVSKLLTLLALAGIIGGSFSLQLARRQALAAPPALLRYLLASTVLGLCATLAYFLVQVGAINQNGVAGMFDPVMGKILLQSGLGQAFALRMAGLVLTLLALWLLRYVPAASLARQGAGLIVWIAALLSLGGSFVVTGHVSTLLGVAQILLALHVLAVFLWTGALYPLLVLSRTPDLSKVAAVMRSFGMQALGIVTVLLASGLYLATHLLQAPAELLDTAYGRLLLLKLTGVSALLLMAALNKLVLVPRLNTAGSSVALQRSIRVEMLAAVFVLAVTSILTTLTGPAGQ